MSKLNASNTLKSTPHRRKRRTYLRDDRDIGPRVEGEKEGVGEDLLEELLKSGILRGVNSRSYYAKMRNKNQG